MAKQLVWLVTGTSSGFGAEFVEQILARGDKVIATARNVDKIKHLKEQGADVLQLDVTASQEVMDVKAVDALKFHGRIDVLVHSAGYIQFGSWEDVDSEALLDIFNTNLFGAVRLTKALLPHFRERRSGTLLFLSSRSGWYGDPWCGAYAGSKFALEGMVESLRWETEKYGVKTLLVVPGRFRSRFLSRPIAAPAKTEAYRDDYEGFLKTIAEEEDGKQPGDLKKGVSVIVDFVREEGVAQGRKVPFRIPIGTDCYETIEQECEATLRDMRDWKDVIMSTDYPERT